MKTVLLAGGYGTRITEESVYRPKPMIEIGQMPILWHIMKEYSYYGHNDFIICAGYKQEYIKKWFADYFLTTSDVTFSYKNGESSMTVHRSCCEPWNVTVVDTGLDTMTGGRIRRIKDYVKDEPFFMTYGDGVCDLDINMLLDFHKSHGKTATLTAVYQDQTKGLLNIDGNNAVKAFREKKMADSSPINAGYMVLEPEIFDYIEGDSTVFESDTMEKLAACGQLMSYIHKGFWHCMDSMREKNDLDALIARGQAPWMKWTK